MRITTSVFVLAVACGSSRAASAIQVLPAGGNARHVACADVIGDAGAELITACYDGSICVLAADGAVHWKYQTRAFPYHLVAGDLNGDGKAEVLVASADGCVYALRPDGRLAWRFESPAPMYQVAVARIRARSYVIAGGVDCTAYILDAAGKKLFSVPQQDVVRLIGAGNLDGDPDDEVVIALQTGDVQAWKGEAFRVLWRARLEGSGHSARFAQWRPYSLHVGDLDGDGRCESVFGGSYLNGYGLRVLGSDGRPRWKRDEGMDFRDEGMGSHSAAVALDMAGNPGKEVVVLNGKRLFAFSADGRQLSVGVSPLTFSNICRGRRADGAPEVVLASAPNGDDRIYRVPLAGRWDRALMRMTREGKMARITENIERVQRQVAAYLGEAPTDRDYVHVVSWGQPTTPEQLRGHFKRVEQFRKRYPYRNTRFAIGIRVQAQRREGGFDRSRSRQSPGGLSDDAAVELLGLCEREGVPFLAEVGHGCEPLITVALARRILEACPRSCLGLVISENADLARLEWMMRAFWYPVMDHCREHGKKAVMVEKFAWWITIPAMERFRRLVDGTYRDVLVMSVEDSNSRSPELNLAGRVGLLLSGAVGGMAARTIRDEVTWSRLWQWECVGTGHPYLRRQMAQALLGATLFDYTIVLTDKAAGGVPTRTSAESLELLIDLLGRGVLVVPRPDEMLGISPGVICMREPDRTFLRDAFNGLTLDRYRDDPVERDSPFEGLAGYWGGAPTRPSYVGRYLFEQDRHAVKLVPPTPFGFVRIVPEFLDSKEGTDAAVRWHSDGRNISMPGSGAMSGLEAAPAVQASFEKASAELPFVAKGHVFLQTQRLGEDRVRLTLIDAGILDPDDRAARIAVRPGVRIQRVVDILSGEEVTPVNGVIPVDVPAGTFRILDVDLGAPL